MILAPGPVVPKTATASQLLYPCLDLFDILMLSAKIRKCSVFTSSCHEIYISETEAQHAFSLLEDG